MATLAPRLSHIDSMCLKSFRLKVTSETTSELCWYCRKTSRVSSDSSVYRALSACAASHYTHTLVHLLRAICKLCRLKQTSTGYRGGQLVFCDSTAAVYLNRPCHFIMFIQLYYDSAIFVAAECLLRWQNVGSSQSDRVGLTGGDYAFCANQA